MGAFYLAWIKTHGALDVSGMLKNIENMLKEGCVGQIPEVYDGMNPGVSKGCFAQAWSVGEILRVYEALEKVSGEERDS